MDLLGSVVALVLLVASVLAGTERPRGVALAKASHYDPSRDFQCLDGSASIKFERVNDDYCDCADGSDEPGTAACPNGSFHCTNAGHKPKYIPSSRVNDGLCDCCDGTDEHDGHVRCANYCKELGAQMKIELEKEKILLAAGYEIYKEYAQKGKEAKTEKQAKLEELKLEKDELEVRKNDLEAIKTDAETPEKEAKDRHHEAWEVEKERRKEERNKNKLQEAFTELDANADQMVSVEEMQRHAEFDIDSNGEVSTEEGKEYLDDNDQVSLELFQEKVWPSIKDIYKKDGATEGEEEAEPTEASPIEDEPPEERDDVDDGDDDDEDDEYDDEEDDEDHFPPRGVPRGDSGEFDDDSDLKKEKQDDEDPMPDYDEETKSLIEAADRARAEYEDVNRKFDDVVREVDEINKMLELDLGENSEFYPLRGECFEYTDREYTYKFCPFEKTNQRSKHGGADTNLGTWGHWDGGADKYSAMKYEKGQNCWHGPDRTCRVKIKCGEDNKLTFATEPNRCEYELDFYTPAACSSAPEDIPYEKDEL